ncbi:MAG: ASKHA domain-containing protein [Oscillospiraceae bacterium]
MKIIVTSSTDKTTIEMFHKCSILEILKENKIYIDAPCNGNGKCGKCKVTATGSLSKITDVEKEILSQHEITACCRLACMTYPIGDCEIEVISESYNIQASGTTDVYAVNSRISSDNAVGMAVDIGTTTVACFFYELKNGKCLYTASGLNKQRSFGADVISRIENCMNNDNGKELLKTTIISELNGFIAEFCNKTGKNTCDIKDAFIAGNTVMLHLLCGLDASSIAVAPFTPNSLFGNDMNAKLLGLNIADEANVYLADCVASYVGGDITAGLLSCNADKFESPCIYIDIGTNGEMALGDKNGFVCCATAAGPAFEGAHIKHGVGGIDGAISKVYIENDEIKFSTINNSNPIGICGSGLIDAIACLLRLRIIDETGRLDKDKIPARYAERYKDDEFILDFVSGITITQKDIREVQLAKAAIKGGINTLLHKSGLNITGIDKVIVAGGFGSYINQKSACEIGLLPREKLESTHAVGNAAGMGAIKALLSKNGLKTLKEITATCNYFELSGDGFFQDEYIEQMMF